MLGLKLYLVDLRGNARYHVAIVPNEWLSAYLNTLISGVSLNWNNGRVATKVFMFLNKVFVNPLTTMQLLLTVSPVR